jgi:hypothetical protein
LSYMSAQETHIHVCVHAPLHSHTLSHSLSHTHTHFLTHSFSPTHSHSHSLVRWIHKFVIATVKKPQMTCIHKFECKSFV